MMPSTIPNDIVDIIQLAVAPVFLIAGIGALLNVMTARLARVIDRSRVLESMIRSAPEGEARDDHRVARHTLDRRRQHVSWATALSPLAALLVCMVIATLFASKLLSVDLSQLIAGLFIATMLALIFSLVLFFMESSIAAQTLRISREFRHRRRR